MLEVLVCKIRMTNDKEKIYSGFMADPLVSIPPRECEALFEEIWTAQEQSR